MKPRPKLATIRRRLLTWFSIHRRDLPWRRTRDPYAILVSEIMLQQTQVDRVIPKYNAWLKKFPTIQTLAQASLQDVLKMWSGLGYNSRGQRLRDLARAVVRDFGGRIPSDVEQLEQLPGIGPYTARAVASFAFRLDEPVIDTNIRRVIGRIFFGVAGPKTERQRAQTVDAIAPAGNIHTWNAALMDFGALVCQARRPKCEICPVQQYCRAYPAVHQPLKQIERPKRIKFEETDRFWRGRIVATLVHSGPMTSKRLKNRLKDFGSLPVIRYTRLLSALASTGIVRRTGQRLSIQA